MMAATPIFGKLSDMYGRKRFFLLGLGLFLLGSMLCGTAQNMIQLSLFRSVQGLGAGALFPIAFTIMFDIFPPEQRGKMSGLFGAVFGLSSIAGPLLGAYITEYAGWRWDFYINVPIGIISILLIAIAYRESMQHTKHKLDWWGAVTLIAAVVSLMFALELGGNKYAWNSPVILGLFAAFAVMFALFLYAETKAAEPILSFAMFRKRLFATSIAASLFYGASFMVATVYIPIFVQGVLGGSAANSGYILMPMSLASVLGSQLGGLLTTRTSYRNIMSGACAIFMLGLFLLSTLTPETTSLMVTLYMIVTGFGVGFSFSVLNMSAVDSFDFRQRGAATSARSFLQSFGMTIGITVFGILQRNQFADKMTGLFTGSGGGSQSVSGTANAQSLLSPETRGHLSKEVLNQVVDALSSSISQTFVWAIVPAALALVSIFLMSNERMPARRKPSAKPEEAREAEPGQ
jgi:EmrB/QacA subfamily drug resistance transporter